MTTRGIKVETTFAPPVAFTDEWLDAVYASIEKNMAIKSVDMFLAETDGTVTFLLGIDDFMDSGDEFVTDLAMEAIDRAFDDAAGPNKRAAATDNQTGAVYEFA